MFVNLVNGTVIEACRVYTQKETSRGVWCRIEFYVGDSIKFLLVGLEDVASISAD